MPSALPASAPATATSRERADRIFVNPASSKGYSATSREAFCDLEHTKAIAKRVRAAGLGLLIDFHYSDTWADPGHQYKPAAWENLDFPALKQAVCPAAVRPPQTLRSSFAHLLCGWRKQHKKTAL